MFDIEEGKTNNLTSTGSHKMDLNVVELATHEKTGEYKPLPIYTFTFNNVHLDTIMDTGAATNYISKDISDKLLNKFPDSLFLKKKK